MVLFLDVFSMSYGRILHYVLPYIYHIQLFLDHFHVISCAIMCYLSRNHFFGGISMVRDEAPLSCWC